MIYARAPQTVPLFLGVVFLAVLKTNSLAAQPTIAQLLASSTAQPTGQQPLNNTLGSPDIALALVINQMVLIRMLNDSSAIHSIRERELQELQDLKHELEARNEMVKNEINAIQAAALNVLQMMKESAVNELHTVKDSVLEELQKLSTSEVQQLRGSPHGKSYKVFHSSVTHAQAITNCAALGGHIAVPTNEKEMRYIQQLVDSESQTWQTFWIGADNAHDGVWTDSITDEPLQYSNFLRGRPDNQGNNNCAVVYDSCRFWDDKSCTTESGYICEFDNA